MHYRYPEKQSKRFNRRGIILGLTLAVAIGLFPASGSAASETIRIGFQPWPGVTVKSTVAEHILDALGYSAERSQLGTTMILQRIANDDLDVNFGIWYPLFADKFDPFVERDELMHVQTNLEETTTAIAVPEYARAAGVESVADLNEHAERFDRKIYGIESGAAWNNHIEAAIESGKHDLGDWELIASSTSGMLTQVQRATSRNEWIVFHSWGPHWMHVKFDLHYLSGPDDSPIAPRTGSVYTVTRPTFPTDQPNVTRLFRQYKVDAEMQNEWIYQHEHEDRSEDEVAREWISNNLDVVEQWVAGVTTVDGETDAFTAVKRIYEQ